MPAQITVWYGYDGSGNRTSATYPSPLGRWSFTPDAVSRVRQTVDGKNQTTTYVFDTIDRTTEIDYADGSKIVQVFDADGDLTKLTDATGSTTYTYDGLNRRLTENPHRRATPHAAEPAPTAAGGIASQSGCVPN